MKGKSYHLAEHLTAAGAGRSAVAVHAVLGPETKMENVSQDFQCLGTEPLDIPFQNRHGDFITHPGAGTYCGR